MADVAARGDTRRRRVTAADLPSLVQGLEPMTIDGLRAEWLRWLPEPVPSLQSKDVLRRLLAWRVQAVVFGGYDPETARRLKQLIADHRVDRPLAARAKARLSVGTVLSREWKGTVHRVTVEARGFTYEGKTYVSLSEIARLITGTRWSGPRLFGVEVERSSGTGRTKA